MGIKQKLKKKEKKEKKIKMADSKNDVFQNRQLWKFHGLVIGLVELIDGKGIASF